MNNLIEMWPGLTFLFSFFNLLAWYMHGAPLFSFWWLIGVFMVEIIILALTNSIASRVAEVKAYGKQRTKI